MLHADKPYYTPNKPTNLTACVYMVWYYLHEHDDDDDALYIEHCNNKQNY